MSASLTMLTGGAFQDSNGTPLSYGYLTLKLSQDGNVAGVGNICSGVTITIQLDVNGNVGSSTSPTPVANQYAWANANISPTNTFYKVTGYTQEGQRAFGPNNQQVGSGAMFNLGSWVPNSVIQWFPNPQSLALEVNGTPASSQTVQNLEAGANITIIDEGNGNIQIAASSGGASFDGNGAYFVGPGLTDLAELYISDTINTASFNSSANDVQVYLFQLYAEYTISKVSIVSLGNMFSVHSTFGIYSYAGAKLVDGGSFVELTGSGVQTNAITPVTLPPGVYWLAQSTDTSTSGQWPAVVITQTTMPTLLSANSTRSAVAANAASGGVLPATLGTLTPFVPNAGGRSGDAIFCPLFE
jgi:hypothetical protein